MIIRFKKRTDGNVALTCVRVDGSTTQSRISGMFGIEHDLAHYAVETTCGLRRAFYGLLASGMDISDFSTPGAARKLDLPLETGQAEFVISLMQQQRRYGKNETDESDPMTALGQQCEGAGTPPPDWIDADMYEQARARWIGLLEQWGTIPPGETMDLAWEE